MNKKLKFVLIFLSVFLGATLLGLMGLAWLNHYFNETSYEEFEAVTVPEDSSKTKEEKELDALYGTENRVNILLAGIEGERTDTLMVCSYDQENNRLDIVSVPRDTYVDYGFKDPGRRKINSVYGYPDSKGGITATAKAVSKVLGIPIHDYVAIDYEGVKKVVDELGGVEVEIPFRMKYDDPYASPPLHINFQAGPKKLNGKQAVEYLRWRKNNYGNAGDGDLGRIGRQQEFVMTVINQSLNPAVFPGVVKVGLENTKTSLNLKQTLYYAGKAVSMDKSKIYTYLVPGEDIHENGLWYYKHDPVATKSMMRDIYNGRKPVTESEPKLP